MSKKKKTTKNFRIKHDIIHNKLNTPSIDLNTYLTHTRKLLYSNTINCYVCS